MQVACHEKRQGLHRAGRCSGSGRLWQAPCAVKRPPLPRNALLWQADKGENGEVVQGKRGAGR